MNLVPATVLAGAVLCAAGCASRESVREVDAGVTRAEASVAALRRTAEESARAQSETLAALRQADQRIVELQASVRELTAQVADLQTRARVAEALLVDLRGQIAALAPVPAAGPVGAPPAPPVPVPPEVAYAAALALLRAGERGQAVLELTDLVTRRSLLSPHAQYWIGEAYFLEQDYRQALIEFYRVFGLDPPPARAADTLLRMGTSHVRLAQASEARDLWRRLIREYPRTEAARRAEALLRGR